MCADVMKNVNKMQYGDLTEEQIAAARQRRSREMCVHYTSDVSDLLRQMEHIWCTETDTG